MSELVLGGGGGFVVFKAGRVVITLSFS
jgi:hypothetical protein